MQASMVIISYGPRHGQMESLEASAPIPGIRWIRGSHFQMMLVETLVEWLSARDDPFHQYAVQCQICPVVQPEVY